MTGVGLAAGTTEAGELRLEIRAVNGRNLALRLRLPAALACYEAAFEEQIRSRIARGSLTVVAELAGGSTALPAREQLLRTAAELRQLATELQLVPPTLTEVIQLVGSAMRAESAASRPLPPQLASLLGTALDDLESHRAADGRATMAAIQRHLAEFRDLVGVAHARTPSLVEAYRDRLRQRVADYVAAHVPGGVPAADLVREVAIHADRIDTAEELQRLQAHWTEFAAVLERGGEVGRRLEFLLQELLRETNTLGAKSPDASLAHTVVAMKSCLDRIKEQLANLA
jgi:uncharacterized protein (TIGR00255 family)